MRSNRSSGKVETTQATCNQLALVGSLIMQKCVILGARDQKGQHVAPSGSPYLAPEPNPFGAIWRQSLKRFGAFGSGRSIWRHLAPEPYREPYWSHATLYTARLLGANLAPLVLQPIDLAPHLFGATIWRHLAPFGATGQFGATCPETKEIKASHCIWRQTLLIWRHCPIWRQFDLAPSFSGQPSPTEDFNGRWCSRISFPECILGP